MSEIRVKRRGASDESGGVRGEGNYGLLAPRPSALVPRPSPLSDAPLYFLCIQYRADSVIQGGTLDGQKVEGKPAWVN